MWYSPSFSPLPTAHSVRSTGQLETVTRVASLPIGLYKGVRRGVGESKPWTSSSNSWEEIETDRPEQRMVRFKLSLWVDKHLHVYVIVILWSSEIITCNENLVLLFFSQRIVLLLNAHIQNDKCSKKCNNGFNWKWNAANCVAMIWIDLHHITFWLQNWKDSFAIPNWFQINFYVTEQRTKQFHSHGLRTHPSCWLVDECIQHRQIQGVPKC